MDQICPFLISKVHLTAVTEYKDHPFCSYQCRGLSDVNEECKFLDKGRFLLSCGHYSFHIQCILSHMVRWGTVNYGQCCPIQDTHECRWKEINAKKGKLYYWAQAEYHSFVIAFLSNKTLTDAFIDAQKL